MSFVLINLHALINQNVKTQIEVSKKKVTWKDMDHEIEEKEG
jgi:hypothetical protein